MTNKIVKEYYREYLQKVSKASIEKYKETQKKTNSQVQKIDKNEQNNK